MEDTELRVLSNFVTIAHCPSLAMAAKKLGVSQPAITRQIQNLEAKFGAPLLKRRSSGILLTRFGERILTRATEFVNEFARQPTGRGNHRLTPASPRSSLESREIQR